MSEPTIESLQAQLEALKADNRRMQITDEIKRLEAELAVKRQQAGDAAPAPAVPPPAPTPTAPPVKAIDREWFERVGDRFGWNRGDRGDRGGNGGGR